MKTNTETLYEIIGNKDKLISAKNDVIESNGLIIKQYREVIDNLNGIIDSQTEMIRSLNGNGDSMVETNLVLIAKVKELQSRITKLTKLSLN